MKRKKNEKLFAKVDLFVDEVLCFPRIKFSKPLTSIWDGVVSKVLLLDIAQKLRRKNADVPDIFSTSLEAADRSPTLLLNQDAKAKERGSWVSLKILTSELAKAVLTGWCCLWICWSPS